MVYGHGYLAVKATINLWESLVRSQLEFAAEILGKEIWAEAETVQMDMCRRVLRCPSKTNKRAMQGDLGLWTLQARRDLKKLLWWMNIQTMDDSRLVKQAYSMSKQAWETHRTNWSSTIKKIFHKYGLDALWGDEQKVFLLDLKNTEAKSPTAHRNYWKTYVKKVIHQVEENKWRAGMEDKIRITKEAKMMRSKLRTYRTFKTKLRLENYLLITGSYRGRMLMTTLRSGTNALEIEKGRYNHLDECDRLCKQCDSKVVENEEHMVTECDRYSDTRLDLYLKIYQITNSKWNLLTHCKHDRFILLLNGTNDEYEMQIYKLFQSFLVKAFKMRRKDT